MLPGRGRRDDQRHMQRRLVRKQAVCLLAVLAEALAVIARDDDQRGTRLARQAAEKRRERGVGPGHFAEIGIRRKLRRPFCGGLIGCVRIVEMHPGEPLRLLLSDPAEP